MSAYVIKQWNGVIVGSFLSGTHSQEAAFGEHS